MHDRATLPIGDGVAMCEGRCPKDGSQVASLRGMALSEDGANGMKDLVERLRVGAWQAKTLNREPTAKLFVEAADGLEAAEARITALTEALRDVLDMSDTKRAFGSIAEVKQTIARARAVLTTPLTATASEPKKLDDEAVVKALYANTLSMLRGT